jgi:hypothetical protein
VPAVVARKVSFRVTVLSDASAVFVADPKKKVGLRMEVKNRPSESIWDQWAIKLMPRFAGIRRVVEFRGVGNEISTVVGIVVRIECEEIVSWIQLIPRVSLVTGLPYGMVLKSYEDGRRVFEVRMLNNLCRELERLVDNVTLRWCRLRALFGNRFILLHASSLVTRSPRDQSIPRGTHIRLVRITLANPCLDGLGADRNTFVVMTDEVVITLVIRILARAVVRMLDWVIELVTNVTVRISLASPVPLLVAHDTFLVCGRPCVPVLEIIFTALPRSSGCEIKKDGSDVAGVFCLILAPDLTEENEFLRCRIGNGDQCTST